MYRTGQGVPRNVNEAAKWYRKAADQGHNDAKKSLQILLGSESPKDERKTEEPDLKEQLELLLKADKLNQAGRYDEAITHYDKVISSKLRSAALGGKGNSLMRLCNYNDAIAYFDRALEMSPNFSMAWNNKGIVMIELGKRAEAMHCFSKALEIDPQDKVALHNYNRLLMEE